MFVYVSTFLLVSGDCPFSLLESFGISRHFLRISSDALTSADCLQVVIALSCHLWQTDLLTARLFHVTAH